MNTLLTTLLGLFLIVNSQSTTTLCDVAIIGGGSAGANSAMFIKRANPTARVCIFEKNSYLGGHCETRYYTLPNGATTWLELGVQVIVNSTKTNSYTDVYKTDFALSTGDYIKSFGLPTVDTEYPQGGGAPNPNVTLSLVYDTSTGTTAPGPAFDSTTNPLYFQIIANFSDYLAQFPWLDGAEWPDPIPAELLQPFSQWLDNHPEFQPLTPLFNSFVTINGLGTFSKLTTVYAFQGCNRGVLQLTLNQRRNGGVAFINGCTKLYQAIASQIGAGVYLNATVTRITRDRSWYPVIISASINNGTTQNFRAKRLIIAIPQTIDNFNKIGLDISAEESVTFNQCRARVYITSLTTASGAPIAGKTYSFTFLDRNRTYPQPPSPSIMSCGRRSSSAPGTCLGFSDDPVTFDQVSNSIYPTGFNTIQNVAGYTITPSEIIQHEYDPFFPLSRLQESPNPYTRIKNLQSSRNTYYVGALMTFSNSARIWDHAYRIITQYNFNQLPTCLVSVQTGSLPTLFLRNRITKFENDNSNPREVEFDYLIGTPSLNSRVKDGVEFHTTQSTLDIPFTLQYSGSTWSGSASPPVGSQDGSPAYLTYTNSAIQISQTNGLQVNLRCVTNTTVTLSSLTLDSIPLISSPIVCTPGGAETSVTITGLPPNPYLLPLEGVLSVSSPVPSSAENNRLDITWGYSPTATVC